MKNNHYDYIIFSRSTCKSYSILEAAILLCDIPEESRATVANEAVPLLGTDVQQATTLIRIIPVWRTRPEHWRWRCSTVSCREEQKDGKPLTFNIPARLWHVDGRELRGWFEEYFSAWRPAFLFPDADPCASPDEEKPLAEKERISLLNLIGALLGTVKGELPGYLAESDYSSEADLITRISKHYLSYPGLSERTIQQNFAAAKRSLS